LSLSVFLRDISAITQVSTYVYIVSLHLLIFGSCDRVPDLPSWGTWFKSYPWLLCTNVNSACNPSRVI